MPARLNRRRYRECVNALKEVVGNPKTPPQRKLRAIETLLGIYDRHDRTEQQKEQRRRSTQQSIHEAAEEQEPQQPVPQTIEDAEAEARRFLQRVRNEEMSTNG